MAGSFNLASFMRMKLVASLSGIIAFIMASCTTMTGPKLEASSSSARLEARAIGELPGWRQDDQFQALQAFGRSCTKLKGGSWKAICSNARTALGQGGNNAARAFFQNNFDAYRILLPGSARGFLTGYFQPEVKGSRRRSAAYPVPVYRRPADLVVRGAGNASQVDKRLTAARRAENGRLVPYYTRREIEQGALNSRGLELVYLASPVDAFFVHVQGSARVALDDGSVMRIGFAAKNGHPYTSIGKVLRDNGELPRDNVTMESIRDWFARNPDRIGEITGQNKSYIFFREITDGDTSLGPEGAQGVPLTTLRSLAVDRNFHDLGLPFWIDSQIPDGNGGLARFQHMLIAQDTGSAIQGVARGDIFFGSGDEAGRRAGPTRHRGDFYVLLPKGGALPAWAK